MVWRYGYKGEREQDLKPIPYTKDQFLYKAASNHDVRVAALYTLWQSSLRFAWVRRQDVDKYITTSCRALSSLFIIWDPNKPAKHEPGRWARGFVVVVFMRSGWNRESPSVEQCFGSACLNLWIPMLFELSATNLFQVRCKVIYKK